LRGRGVFYNPIRMNQYKNILVTGGAGFVGSNLIRALVKLYPHLNIVSLDNYFIGTTERHVKSDRVTYLAGNTNDIAKIYRYRGLPRPDAIFHLGEYSRIVQSFDDIDLVWEFNIAGTKEVVRFAHDCGCKMFYAGSSSKFGNGGADENLSPYAWMKAKNIEYIKNYANWFGLDYVVGYFYNVYGPGHQKTGKYATLIGIFETQYEQGLPLTVVSPGTQTRDFTHIDDIVRGILLAFELGSGDGYQIGAGHEHTILEVAEMFGNGHVFIPERKGERVRGQADNAKVRALGWKPEHNVRDYIEEFKKQVKIKN